MDRLFHWLVIAQEGLPGANEPAATGGVASATSTGNAPSPSAPGFDSMSLMMIFVMIAIFYFLLIRPQQKRAKKHKNLITSLKRGDTVITSSGIFGTITTLEENLVTLEVAKGTRIKVLRNFISGLANGETEKELAQAPPA